MTAPSLTSEPSRAEMVARSRLADFIDACREMGDANIPEDLAVLYLVATMNPKKATDLCLCGHDRGSHVYSHGPCRPGFVCREHCEVFAPAFVESRPGL